MDFDKLRIIGADVGNYRLGESMRVFDHERYLGTLDPVEISEDSTEIRISRFTPAVFVQREKRNFGPLVLLEVTSFIAQAFANVQLIRYALSREIEI